MGRMEIEGLVAGPREGVGTRAARRLRRAGKVPAVLYGHGRETLALAVDAPALARLAARGARIVALETPHGAEQALIKELQYDVYHTRILHADFARIALDEAVSVEVPIETHGAAAEGALDQTLHVLTVRCRADRIPEKVRVEVDGLRPGDTVAVKDLVLPEGVAAETPADTVVVAVHAQREAVVEAAPEAPAEPELVREKAKEAEEAEGDEAAAPKR